MCFGSTYNLDVDILALRKKSVSQLSHAKNKQTGVQMLTPTWPMLWLPLNGRFPPVSEGVYGKLLSSRYDHSQEWVQGTLP